MHIQDIRVSDIHAHSRHKALESLKQHQRIGFHKEFKIEGLDFRNALEGMYTTSSIDESGVTLNQTNLVSRYL